MREPEHPSTSPRVPRGRSGSRLDASAGVDLVIVLPLLVSSLFVVALLGRALTPATPWLVPLLWALSGAVVFLPWLDVVTSLSLRLRRPTAVERARFEPLWERVCERADVADWRYSLWIQNSHEVNAMATGGRVVAVTTAALRLPPARLEAVLAHELGHHLSGHTTISMLKWWYGIPARLVVWLVGLVVRFVLAVGRLFLAFGNTAVALGSVVVALVLLLLLFVVNPWLLLAPVLAPLLAWSSRRAELHADRVAADLGYGRSLLEVLRGWLRDGHDEARARAGLRARMLASHPSCADRIRRLETRLA